MCEIRKNLKRQNSPSCRIVRTESDSTCNLQDIPSTSAGGSSSAHVNFIDDAFDPTRGLISKDDHSSSASSDSKDDDTSPSLFFDSSAEPPFRERLATCFIENNLTHTQGNSVLSVLRTHPCFSNLPKDVRTILDTPRGRVTTFNVQPGEYVRSGVEAELVVAPANGSSGSTVTQLQLDFSTDGAQFR